MTPIYIPDFLPSKTITATLLADIPWEQRTEARSECFMAPGDTPVVYTYGKGRGVRTYTSIPMSELVETMQNAVNCELDKYPGWGPMTGCFLNRYDHDRQALSWHADDFPGMDHTRCVAVLSYGEAREIWWRVNTPTAGRVVESQLLASGSLFIMPPGMQHTHEHRIPKGSRAMGPRVSLTFRAFF